MTTHLHHRTRGARHDVSLWRKASGKQQRIATDRAMALAWRLYPASGCPEAYNISHYLGNMPGYLEVVTARDSYRRKRSALFTRAYVRLLNAQLKGK